MSRAAGQHVDRFAARLWQSSVVARSAFVDVGIVTTALRKLLLVL
jgi:hypothetical protein